MQGDREGLLAVPADRGQLDLVDQGAHDLRRLGLAVVMGERGAQVGHPLAVDPSHVRMHRHLHVLALGQLRFQHLLPCLEMRHPVLDRARRRSIQQRLNQSFEVAVDPGELRPGALPRRVVLAGERVHVARVLIAEHRHQLGVHQPVLQPLQDGGLELVPAHSALVRAGPFVAGVPPGAPGGSCRPGPSGRALPWCP